MNDPELDQLLRQVLLTRQELDQLVQRVLLSDAQLLEMVAEMERKLDDLLQLNL